MKLQYQCCSYTGIMFNLVNSPICKKSIWDLLRTDSLIYFILIKTSFAKWVKISISLSKGRLILNCTICLYDFYVLFLHVLVNWYILVVNFLYSYAEYNLMNSIFNQIKIQDLCIWQRNTFSWNDRTFNFIKIKLHPTHKCLFCGETINLVTQTLLRVTEISLVMQHISCI